MSGIKIIVATHKEYWMPEDSMYLPIQVGAEGKDYDLGYIKDNTGKNISSKNANSLTILLIICCRSYDLCHCI